MGGERGTVSEKQVPHTARKVRERVRDDNSGWAGRCGTVETVPADGVYFRRAVRLPRRILAMPLVLRAYDSRDFSALFRLDQSCFPAGIAYSKTTLRYFLSVRSADCLVAMVDAQIAGFILTEENPPLAHVITLDVAEKFRRQRVASTLLAESERTLALRGTRTVLLETATDNAVGVAFWQHRGYGIAATLKRYYLGKLDAYEMRKILLPANERAAKKEI